jgi:superkiller protein 3
MAAVVKAKLKAARDAIGKKNWEAARDAATGVLDFEPDNYNAFVKQFSSTREYFDKDYITRNVFLGLASLELGDNERSEQVIHFGRVCEMPKN